MCSLLLKKIRNPVLFQGSLQRKNYFEGWYFKQASRNENTIISFIPGISLCEADPHAFVQYILVTIDDYENKTTQTGYVRYDLNDFSFCDQPFNIQVGANCFSETSQSILLRDRNFNVQGTLQIGQLLPIKTSILMPNIMGPFAYLPRMECYHAIVSMNHTLDGNLVIDNRLINFTSGKGYIEKDWGTSFPKEYIWIQSNHFQNSETSIFLSVAHIPFIFSSFQGFICNLIYKGQEYRFATYNKSTVCINKVSNEEVCMTLSRADITLTIKASNSNPGQLVAPLLGNMEKIIKEGGCEEVHIKLVDIKNKLIYEDVGRLAGIEVVGYNIKVT